MKILIVSNGHGEDLVGAELAKKLPAGYEISALPIVGEGKAYEGHCEILGPRKKLPGGGFSLRNFSSFLEDIKEGYLNILWEQYKVLKCQKPDLVVGIGDIVPILGAKLTKAPLIFIGVNKTDYYLWFGYSYTPWEILLLKSAKRVFTRDRLTANNLATKGIKAVFFGNPLMDIVVQKEPKLEPRNLGPKTIGFLPGTRENDINLNIKDFVKLAQEIKKLDEKVEFIMALKEPRILTSHIPSPFIVKPFEEVLAESRVIIGLSGTGNEQAAGVGVPVVSFPGSGPQYNKRFGEAQSQLLGEALIFVRKRDFEKIARKTIELLKNSQLRADMGRIGQARMGGYGAIKKIADLIVNGTN